MESAEKIPIAASVNEYIKRYPLKVQVSLKKIRSSIKKTAPEAEEVISYGIPGYKYRGMLIYFAGFTNHISVYPAPRQHKLFKKELAPYKGGKGTVQFPLDKPIPFDLVKRIVQFRMKENKLKYAAKSKIKNSKN